MVVETSAVVAVLAKEPGWEQFEAAMNGAQELRISAASVVETALVVENRFGALGRTRFDEWLVRFGIEIAPVTAEQAAVARDGFRRYGKGRHPAALNFGDCFSYALATVTKDELLFKGRDFSQTDVRSALRLV